MSAFDDVIKQKMKAWDDKDLMNPASRGDKIPFSSPLVNWATYGGIPRNRITEFFGEPGGGKAQPLYSKVLTPDGYKTMGEMKVGDKVFDGKGNVCSIDGVFPQGERDVYEIRLQDNTSFRVADNHLNSVWWNDKDGNRVDEVLTTIELIEKKEEIESQGLGVVNIDPAFADWDEHEVLIDPYLLGVYLSDGGLVGNIAFANDEKDVIDKVDSILQRDWDLKLVCSDDKKPWKSWSIENVSDDSDKPEAFLSAIKEYGIESSLNKRIPKDYLFNSREVRLNFVHGLYDACGYTAFESIDYEYAPTDDSVYSYTTGSEEFSQDCEFLFRSLGMLDTVKFIQPKHGDPKFIKQHNIGCYDHFLYIPSEFDVFTSKKNKDRSRDVNRVLARGIVSIVKTGHEECQCIHVDSDEHTYITDNFILTHNTTTAVDVCKNASEIFQKEWEDECASLRGQSDKSAKLRLAELEDSGPRKILYLDLEHSFDTEWAKTLGVDTTKIAIMQPPDVPAEEILQTVQEMVETNEVGLIVLDSIPSLVPKAVLEKKYGERTVASLAGILDVFMKKITQILMRYETTLLMINQVRDNLDNPYVVHTPGGQAVKFFCSLRIQFTLGNPIDIVGNELPKKTEDPAGYKVLIRLAKQKSAPNDRRNASYFLLNQSGIKPEMDYAQLAITKYGFIRKAGGWFTICDPVTGEILESDGKPLKIQGLPKVYDYIETHPDYYDAMKNFIEDDINNVKEV